MTTPMVWPRDGASGERSRKTSSWGRATASTGAGGRWMQRRRARVHGGGSCVAGEGEARVEALDREKKEDSDITYAHILASPCIDPPRIGAATLAPYQGMTSGLHSPYRHDVRFRREEPDPWTGG
jgi:hypothetical protein